MRIYFSLPCGDSISYNLTTGVISLWDSKIYLDLDLQNVVEMRKAKKEKIFTLKTTLVLVESL